MRKYISARLLTLLLLLMLSFTATALAATCALCGGETGGDSYLCTPCLLELLADEGEPSPIEITAAKTGEDGLVTIAWTDSEGNAPYTVYYELLEAAPTAFGWTAAEGVADTGYTFTRLVPGVSYIFTVMDSEGNAAQYTYFAPKTGTDTEIGAKIRLKAMNRTGRMTKKQVSFSAAEIAAENETTHGLYLRLTYSMLKKTRSYAFAIAVEAPNGFSDVILSGNLELSHGRSYIPVWGFIPMDDYFALLDAYYGGVPTGEYDVTIYFNGAQVHTASFMVSE